MVVDELELLRAALNAEPDVRPQAEAAAQTGTHAAPRVLVVDDDAAVRDSLSRALRTCGYEPHTAETGDTALHLLRRARFAAMICDVRMPGLSGVDTLRAALAHDPELAVVMLTGMNDALTATDALTGGAMDYLVKPVQLPTLRSAVERALHSRHRQIEQRRVEGLIREEVALRTTELEQEKVTLRAMNVRVAETLVNAMEVKDVYLRGHSQRVASLGAEIAEELGLDAETVERVRLAGRLHDVGKIGIREAVLNKPGALTPGEYAHVKEHVIIGMEILAPLEHLGEVLTYVHDHHEHWDGGGYPRGLNGEEISIGGRILAAADAFDALTSRRAYREPMAPAQVIAYLGETEVGRLLDPDVYRALKTVVVDRQSLALTFIDDLHG